MKCAVYAGTANLYDDMETAAKSLIANSDVESVYFLIEDSKFPSKLPDMITCVNVKRQRYFPKTSANIKTPFSYLAMMRAALALMPTFKDVDKILSLDCDTVVIRDASGIWDMPIEDCYFSASREPSFCRKGLIYCNTGVALYNLKKLRDGKAKEVVNALNKQVFPNVEQDAFSYLCQGSIHDMPSKYNANKFTEKCQYPTIVHYAGIAADVWRTRAEPYEYRNMTWAEVMELHARYDD